MLCLKVDKNSFKSAVIGHSGHFLFLNAHYYVNRGKAFSECAETIACPQKSNFFFPYT